MNLVLDASVALAWCFPDEATPAADSVLEQLLGGEAVVPTVWPREITNALITGVRRGRLTDEEARTAQKMFEALPIVVEPLTRREVFEETVRLARLHELSSYDAAYLELARRLDIPLATTDRALARAAGSEGVVLPD